MLKALLAFIPLLAGYLFVTRWHESRYLIRRQDSQGVYFYAAFAGIVLLVLAAVLIQLLKPPLAGLQRYLYDWAQASLPLEATEKSPATAYWLIVLGVTLFMGFMGSHVLNFAQALKTMNRPDYTLVLGQTVRDRKASKAWRWNLWFYIKGVTKGIYGYSSHKPLERAVDRMNADFEVILLRALDQGMPVCFTLRSGKVYVGTVSGAIDPIDSRDMLRILPLMSGYRKSETHKVTFTTFYHKLYGRLDRSDDLSHLHPEKFEIAFCFADVQSVNLFDIQAYLEFQKDGPPGAN